MITEQQFHNLIINQPIYEFRKYSPSIKEWNVVGFSSRKVKKVEVKSVILHYDGTTAHFEDLEDFYLTIDGIKKEILKDASLRVLDVKKLFPEPKVCSKTIRKHFAYQKGKVVYEGNSVDEALKLSKLVESIDVDNPDYKTQGAVWEEWNTFVHKYKFEKEEAIFSGVSLTESQKKKFYTLASEFICDKYDDERLSILEDLCEFLKI